MSNVLKTRNDLDYDQKRAVNFIRNKKSAAIWVLPGLGKTVTVMTALKHWFDEGEIKKVLVIAPRKVAISVWPNEGEEWEHLKNFFKVSLLFGTASERIYALHKPAHIYAVSFNNVPWLMKYLGPDFSTFDVLIVDESTKLKNFRGAWFSAAKNALEKYSHANLRSIVMTGTPRPNSDSDLWAQTFIVDRGKRLGRTITDFRRRYMHKGYNRWEWHLNEGAPEKIAKAINDIVFQIKDEGKLPPVAKKVLYFELPPRAMEIYKAHERVAINEYLEEKHKARGIKSPIANIMTRYHRLSQIASGFLEDKEEGSFEILHTEKISLLEKIMEEEGHNALVAHVYKPERKMLLDNVAGCEDYSQAEDFIDVNARWNHKTIRAMLLQPSSDAHGLQFQFGSPLVVHYSFTYNFEDNQQVIGRLRRRNSPFEQIIVYYLVAKNTIEEVKLESINRKRGLEDAFKKYLEGCIKRLGNA